MPKGDGMSVIFVSNKFSICCIKVCLSKWYNTCNVGLAEFADSLVDCYGQMLILGKAR